MTKPFGAPEIAHVQLGETTYDVVPQPLPYLEYELGEMFSNITEGEALKNIDGLSGVIAAITGGAHTLLSVFIDDLMPLHKWKGYRTAAEMEIGKSVFDKDYARQVAPTGPQVRLAIRECFRISGLDMWESLKSLVDPTMLQDMVSEAVDGVRQEMKASRAASSQTPSSPSTPAESPSSTSTTTSDDALPLIEGPPASASPSPA